MPQLLSVVSLTRREKLQVVLTTPSWTWRGRLPNMGASSKGSSIRRSHALPVTWNLSRHFGVRSVAIRTFIIATLSLGFWRRQCGCRFGPAIKGAFSAMETVAGPLHDLTGEGKATQMGRFTITARFNVTPPPVNATGTATWTASNGDQLFTSTAGTAVIAFPTATITETHTITGGTGRFAAASGTLSVERVLNIQSLRSTATVTGSLTLGR